MVDERPSAELIDEILSLPLLPADAMPDPLDPNYWVYLMHDADIEEPVDRPTHAALAFYGHPGKARK
jgi:hypothetical protein